MNAKATILAKYHFAPVPSARVRRDRSRHLTVRHERRNRTPAARAESETRGHDRLPSRPAAGPAPDRHVPEPIGGSTGRESWLHAEAAEAAGLAAKPPTVKIDYMSALRANADNAPFPTHFLIWPIRHMAQTQPSPCRPKSPSCLPRHPLAVFERGIFLRRLISRRLRRLRRTPFRSPEQH